MGWIFLLISVVFEVSWASTLKYTEGYSRLWPSIGNALLGVGGVLTLANAVKTLPTTMAYCIWTGLSAVIITVLGRVVFGEPLGFAQGLLIGLIIISIVGLKALSSG